jgi:hypothetical protein
MAKKTTTHKATSDEMKKIQVGTDTIFKGVKYTKGTYIEVPADKYDGYLKKIIINKTSKTSKAKDDAVVLAPETKDEILEELNKTEF